MKRLKKVHILKEGKINLPDGSYLDSTNELMEELAETYDPKNNHEAPVVLGHDADPYFEKRSRDDHDGKPADGWVVKVYKLGNDLYADLDVTDEVKKQIDDKKYKKLSISFYPKESPMSPVKGKCYLRHIALLGASPPVVKGLKPYSFSEAGFYNLSETTDMEYLNEYKNFMDSTASMQLKTLLEEGDRGFKEGIKEFDPMPSAENNYLTNGNKISGVFISDNDDRFTFEIIKSGDKVERSFSPENPKELDQKQKNNPIDQLAEDLINEPMDTSLGYRNKVSTPSLTEETMKQQDKAMKMMALKKAMEELESEQLGEEEPITEEEIIKANQFLNETMSPTPDDISSQMAVMMEELNKLKQENETLKMAEERRNQEEIKMFAEGLYKNGTLTNSQVSLSELTEFLNLVSKISQPVKLSEGKGKESTLTWVKGFLSKLPKQVSLGEMAKPVMKDTEKPSPTNNYQSPAYTQASSDSLAIHQKAIALAEKRNLDYKKDPSIYRQLVKEVMFN